MLSRMDEFYDDYHQVKTDSNVVPDDVWKKFDLEDVMDIYPTADFCDSLVEESSPMWPLEPLKQSHEVSFLHMAKPVTTWGLPLNGYQDVREIRNHDCMWAGLCIAREHNRTCTKKFNAQSTVPAGRSLLIPKNQTAANKASAPSTSTTTTTTTTTTGSSSVTSASAYYANCRSQAGKQKSQESDGDSTRPETPQSKAGSFEESETETESSSEEEEEEEEDEDEEEEAENEVDDGPVSFSHDQIDIATMISSRPSEVTGQKIQQRSSTTSQSLFDRRKDDDRIHQQLQHQLQQQQLFNNSNGHTVLDTNTHLMSDHCYHLNQQPTRKLDHLGVQTPSDSGESEEEIDVVNLKPVKQSNAALSLLNTPDHHLHFNQLTVNSLSAYKDRKNNSRSNDIENVVPVNSIPPTPTPRPRGRPPLNPANRKRPAQTALTNSAAEKPATKRARISNRQSNAYAKKARQQHQQQQKLQQQHQQQLINSRNCSSEDEEIEPDTEKRSLHNNMERQRRIELRQAFEELRLLVPAVQDKEKAPKVAILKQSAIYCEKLAETEEKYAQEYHKLKRQQALFRERLRILRVDYSRNQGR